MLNRELLNVLSQGRVFVAVLVFIALELSIFVLNQQIAQQVAEDAVAINLAGRQRMLSQKMTKAALLAQDADDITRASASAELRRAHAVFAETLRAFLNGGTTTGTDGMPATLTRLTEPVALAAASRARDLLDAMPWVVASDGSSGTEPLDGRLRSYLVAHNLELLDAMHALTNALEQDSVERIGNMRMLMFVAFCLALINFFIIVLTLLRQKMAADRAHQHWKAAAGRDALTGLCNRASFDESLPQIAALARQDGAHLALFMIDLNDFKDINDTFGHAAGDDVLRQVADGLRTVARDTDHIARLGGDEFAIICPGLHRDAALLEFTHRLEHAVRQVRVASDSRRRISACIGVAVYPTETESLPGLLELADAAMYQGKRDHHSIMPGMTPTTTRPGARPEA